MMQRLDAMHQDPTANQEHRRSTNHRQAFHHVRRRPQDAVTHCLSQPGGFAGHPQPKVVKLDDPAYQPIHTNGHHHRNARQHDDLLGQRRVSHDTQGNGDDFRRQDEVGTHRPLDLGFFKSHQVNAGIGNGLLARLVLCLILFLAVQELVRQLLETLEAQERATQHQQRRNRPRYERTDQQRGRYQDRLVDERPLGHRPDDRKFAIGAHAGDLLGIQRQVVTQHTRCLFRRDFGH
ncbi:hypothetical protein D3C80_1331750 [compost metagenome]